MSYILDALKKTEQEKQRGSAPSLNSQPQKMPPRGPKRPGWLYLLIVVLLLNAGVLLWWLKPWQHGQVKKQRVATVEKKERTAPHPVSVAKTKTGRIAARSSAQPTHPSVSEAVAPAVAVGKPGPKLPATPAEPALPGEMPEKGLASASEHEGAARKEGPALARPSSQLAKVGTTVQQRVSVPVETGRGPHSPTAMIDANGISVPAGVPESQSVHNGKASTRLPQAFHHSIGAAKVDATGGRSRGGTGFAGGHAAFNRQSSPSSGINQKVAVAGNVLLNYSQLPLSLQKQLPPLDISLHFYADKPERRLVNIDGQMRHEKDQIEKDLTIEKITPDGVIFNYAGRRFLKKVFP